MFTNNLIHGSILYTFAILSQFHSSFLTCETRKPIQSDSDVNSTRLLSRFRILPSCMCACLRGFAYDDSIHKICDTSKARYAPWNILDSFTGNTCHWISMPDHGSKIRSDEWKWGLEITVEGSVRSKPAFFVFFVSSPFLRPWSLEEDKKTKTLVS